MNRRHALTALASGSVLGLSASGLAASASKPPGAVPPGKHVLVPLPFDPKKLTGLSERLLVSHHENNYGGALKNLNKVEEELQRVNKDTPGFVVGGLRERELTFGK